MIISPVCSDFSLDAAAKSIFGMYPEPRYLLEDKKAVPNLAAIIKTIFNQSKAQYIHGSTKALGKQWWINNGDGTHYTHAKLSRQDIVENDYEVMMKLPGVGPEVAAMVLYVVFDEIHCVPVDRHVRRFMICFGFASSRVDPKNIGLMAEKWFDHSQWINLNYVSAGIAQTLALLKCPPELARFQKDLMLIANDYNFLEDMMIFIQMN
jgi:endonuclease III